MKKINSSFDEKDLLEGLIARDIRSLEKQIYNMSQKKFRRGDAEELKYYEALKAVLRYYNFKNEGIR